MQAWKEDVYTINDIYNLSEGERAELIDGKMYMMAPPSRTHQKLVHFFDRVIVFNFDCDMMEEYSFEDAIPAGIFEGFSIENRLT